MQKNLIILLIVMVAVAAGVLIVNDLFLGLHPAVIVGVLALIGGVIVASIVSKNKKKDDTDKK